MQSIRYLYLVFKSICHILPKTQISPKLKGYQNGNTIKTKMSLEPKCHWTDSSSKLKYHCNWNYCTTGLSNLIPEVWHWLPLPCYLFFLGKFLFTFFILTKGWNFLMPGINKKVTHDYIFTMAPTLVGPWSCDHQFRMALTKISN